MHELRLIGVHEDGRHLVLSDGRGNRFLLPVDEALRAAIRTPSPRGGEPEAHQEDPPTLRPREVQALIREGVSAEEVARRAGWPLEKVNRYEGPILAEREHVAGLARDVRLRPRGGGQGSSPTLEERVEERLRSREIDVPAARWDSFRRVPGSWTVVLTFHAGGRERRATWEFDPLARTVAARDDEARWLSEDDEVDRTGPLPAARAAVGDPVVARVPDVRQDPGVPVTAEPGPADPVDLMAAMRERSGQRPRGRRQDARGGQGPERRTGAPPRDRRPAARRDEPSPVPVSGADDAQPPDEPAEVAVEREEARTGAAGRARQPATRRSGKPSVPSWDDIVFGRKPE